MEDVLDNNGNIKEQIDINLIQLPKNLPKNLVNSIFFRTFASQ